MSDKFLRKVKIVIFLSFVFGQNSEHFYKKAMWKKFRILVCLLIVQMILSLPAFAQGGKDLMIIRETNKVALVIGNSDYKNGFSQLKSPRNDAAAMAEALKRLDFRLVGNKAHLDATFAEMEKLIDLFTDELKKGGVVFFYFSGHGSQDGFRDNFLIPVDTQIRFQSDLKHKALKIEFITSRMEETGNRLNILVFDACRNNPLPSGFKSGNNGLNTNREFPSGVYIAFAARDGQTALDGNFDGYSLYTRELLKNIEEPDERLEDIFIRTRIAVKNETKNKQFPIDYGSLDGRFYFKSSVGNVPNNSNNPPNRIKEAQAFLELGYKCEASDYDCQISNYTKAINLNPQYANAYILRGVSYSGRKDYDAAIRDYTEAIRLSPNDASPYNNRGVSYYLKGDENAAIRDYTEAIRLDPKTYYYYSNRANSYERIGEKDKAQADRKKADDLKKP